MNNWVEQVKNSIPEHSEKIKNNLDEAINNSALEEADAHACAFVSAISSGNGELAFEISMNGPLMGSSERELAKKAASFIGMSNVYHFFQELYDATSEDDHFLDVEISDSDKSKFEMYALAAGIASKCKHNTEKYLAKVSKQGLTNEQIQSIGKISAVVSSIGKIAL